MGKKDSPDTPDVAGAAAVEGEFARETARDVTYADRPDQYNPFGSLKWQQYKAIDPGTGEPVTKWRQVQKLAPESKKILDFNLGLTKDKAKLAESMMGRVEGEMGGAPDWAQFGDVQGLDYDPMQLRLAAENAAYRKEKMRLNPQYDRLRDSTDLRLRNQGLAPGDQAYDAQMDNFMMGRTDAFESARLGATEIGRAEADQLWNQQLGGTQYANALRQQQIQEYIGQRGYTLGEVEGLTEGQNLTDLVKTFGGGAS